MPVCVPGVSVGSGASLLDSGRKKANYKDPDSLLFEKVQAQRLGEKSHARVCLEVLMCGSGELRAQQLPSPWVTPQAR